MTAFALFLWAVVAAQSGGLPATQPDGPRIRKLQIVIPDGIERREVMAVLQSAEGKPFSMADIDLDVRRLYVALPLENVVVYTEPHTEGVDVRFELLPRVVLSTIELTGNNNLEREEILAVVDLKEGAEFREGALPGIAAAVRRFYADNGYYETRVNVVPRRVNDRTAELLIRIDEGPRAVVGALAIGAPGGEAGWLTDAMDLEPGTPYSTQRLREARDRLSERLSLRGYREFQIGDPVTQYNQRENKIRIFQKVDPGPRVEFKFSGNRFLERRDLEAMLQLETRPSLTPGAVDDFSRRIRELYRSWGYYQAVVELQIDNDLARNRKTYVFKIFEGEQAFISDVRFVGNHYLTSDELYAVQRVRNRRPLAAVYDSAQGTLAGSLRDTNEVILLQAYQRAGFQAALISRSDLQLVGTELVLTYTIVEGPRTVIDLLEFTGNSALKTTELRSELGLNPGEPFNPFALEEGREKLRTLYQRNGFIEAKIRVEEEYPQGVSSVVIKVLVHEGPKFRVGQIFLQGNTRTDDSVLRNSLLMKTGDVLDPDILLETQRAIYRLGIFGSVSVEVLSKDLQARVANIIVKVREKNNGSVDFGVEVGTAEGVILSAEIGHRNVFNSARSIRSLAEVAFLIGGRSALKKQLNYPNEFRIETVYREPWIFRTKWAGTLGYTTEQNRREKYYNYTANRIVLGGDRELTPHWRFFPNYRWETDVFFPKSTPADCAKDEATETKDAKKLELRVDDPKRCDANPTAAKPATVRDLGSTVNLGRFNVAGLEPLLIGDYRNDRFNPTQGWYTTYRLFYALKPLGSDFHFLRHDFLISKFVSLAPKWVAALGVRAGHIKLLSPTTTLIKPQKFTLGGANSLRGFGLNTVFLPTANDVVESQEDGGLVMAGYQAELRFPLFWGIGGVVFQDAGQVWSDLSAVKLPLLFSAGPGLRYDTPVGPIRLDAGWKLNPKAVPCTGCKTTEYEIHFAIGNAF